ncbi:MAG: hypothetical protein GC134_08590 [Proteobacteria bacterium]|nr:hypothetical protein [Pseudomonadota bacterium]
MGRNGKNTPKTLCAGQNPQSYPQPQPAQMLVFYTFCVALSHAIPYHTIMTHERTGNVPYKAGTRPAGSSPKGETGKKERTLATFLSSYTNKVDKKGRVSVPADFRAELSLQSRQTVVVYAAPDEGFLFAWGYDDFLQFAERIKRLPPMSKERQRLGRSILAAARPLGFDSEGRIMLPEAFMKIAGVTEQALFAGQGEYFTIWDPSRYDTKQAEDLTFYEADLSVLSEGDGQ